MRLPTVPREHVVRSGPRQALAFVVVLAAALAAGGSALAEPSLDARQSQAESVLAQIRSIDSELDHAVDAYNLANLRLDRIERDQQKNRRYLRLARRNLAAAQRTLSKRLVYMYTTGSGSSTIEVLLGARSLDELVSRVETMNRVSAQDTEVLREVTRFRAEVQRRVRELRAAHAKQAEVVAAREAEQQRIEARLAQRQALLSTIRDEIARMQAAERARQAALRRQAEARLPAQQAAQQAAQDSIGVAASTPDATVAPPQVHGGVVGIALQFLGVPYVYGGASPKGFDCSGLVMYAFAQIGVSLPHNAAAQYGYGTPVAKNQLQPGDLVFFNGLGHNGIYIGGGQFVHAPHTGDVVKISSLSGDWYAQTYVGARRI